MNFLSIATVMALGITFYNVDSEVRTNLEKVEEKNQLKNTIDKTIVNQNKMQFDNSNNRYFISNKLATASDETLNIMRKIDSYLSKNKMNLLNYNNTGNKITSSELCSVVFENTAAKQSCNKVLSEDYNFIVLNEDGTSSFIVENSNIDFTTDVLSGGNSFVSINNSGENVVTTKLKDDSSLKKVNNSLIDNNTKIYTFNSNNEIIQEKAIVKDIKSLETVQKTTSVTNSEIVKDLTTDTVLKSNELGSDSLKSTTIIAGAIIDNSVLINKLEKLITDWNNCSNISNAQEIMDQETNIRKYLGNTVYQNWLNNKYKVESQCYLASLKNIDVKVTNAQKESESIIVSSKTPKEEADEILRLIKNESFDKIFLTNNLSYYDVKNKIKAGYSNDYFLSMEKDFVRNAKRFFYNSTINSYNNLNDYNRIDVGKTTVITNYDTLNLDTLIAAAKNKLIYDKSKSISESNTYVNQSNYDSNIGLIFDPTKVTNSLDTTTISNGSGSFNTVD